MKCTKIYNARAQLLFCSLKLLFGDVLVSVIVVFCLSSLIIQNGSDKVVTKKLSSRSLPRQCFVVSEILRMIWQPLNWQYLPKGKREGGAGEKRGRRRGKEGVDSGMFSHMLDKSIVWLECSRPDWSLDIFGVIRNVPNVMAEVIGVW